MHGAAGFLHWLHAILESSSVARVSKVCIHKIAHGNSDLIKIALARFADSSRTSHEVREEPVAAVRSEDLVHNECVHIALCWMSERGRQTPNDLKP
jgi:hypothetical protein